MSHQQHRRQKRGWESEQDRKEPSQLLNKKKEHQSAVCSPLVKEKLKQAILRRKDQSAEPASNLPAPLRKQSLDVSSAADSYNFREDNQLRRTVSEPVLKMRSKRSFSSRQQELLQRKADAPFTVGSPDAAGGSLSSASASTRSSQPDEVLRSFPPPQNYITPQSAEAEAVQFISVHASTLFCPVVSQGWSSSPLQSLYPQILTLHPQHLPLHFSPLTVHLPCAPMSHRPVFKTQSAPSYFPEETHAHSQTYTHAIPQQYSACLQQRSQHTPPREVIVHRVCPVCPGEEDNNRSSDEERDGGRATGGLLRVQHLRASHESHHHLTRVHSSPDYYTYDQSVSSPLTQRSRQSGSTCLVLECDCADYSVHSEFTMRILNIWSRLKQSGLMKHCQVLKGWMDKLDDHVTDLSETHNSINLKHEEMSQTACGGKEKDTISYQQLKTTASSVTELTLRVTNREFRNGFAVIRPAGGHTSQTGSCGLSAFHSVAVAAKQLQDKLKAKKILIVDWDVHHSFGTEEVFYEDPGVLCISVHRYDNGSFFRGTGDSRMVGSGRGRGYNVNVPWSGGLNPPMGDAEYLAAFRTVVLPIAREFCPEVVLVSAGFDAAAGHDAVGGYKVSAKCFGVLTRKLMQVAEGHVILVLEGGYDLSTLCDASQACVSALIGHEPEPLDEEELLRAPCYNAVNSLKTVLHVQSRYWRSVRSMLDTVSLSYLKAERRSSAGSEVASALDALTMTVPSRSCFPNEPMEHDEAESM